MTYLEMNQSSSLKRATVQSNNSRILWIKNQLHMNLCVVQPKGCQNILKMDVISLGMISRSFLLCWAILFALLPWCWCIFFPWKCILQHINQWRVCVCVCVKKGFPGHVQLWNSEWKTECFVFPYCRSSQKSSQYNAVHSNSSRGRCTSPDRILFSWTVFQGQCSLSSLGEIWSARKLPPVNNFLAWFWVLSEVRLTITTCLILSETVQLMSSPCLSTKCYSTRQLTENVCQLLSMRRGVRAHPQWSLGRAGTHLHEGRQVRCEKKEGTYPVTHVHNR